MDRFAVVGDPREACKLKEPPGEVELMVTCATVAGCDDGDEIAGRGVGHLDFLRRGGEFFLADREGDTKLRGDVDADFIEITGMPAATAFLIDGPCASDRDPRLDDVVIEPVQADGSVMRSEAPLIVTDRSGPMTRQLVNGRR